MDTVHVTEPAGFEAAGGNIYVTLRSRKKTREFCMSRNNFMVSLERAQRFVQELPSTEPVMFRKG